MEFEASPNDPHQFPVKFFDLVEGEGCNAQGICNLRFKYSLDDVEGLTRSHFRPDEKVSFCVDLFHKEVEVVLEVQVS